MEVRLPKLGEGAESGSVANIFVKAGDLIKKDQAVIELESEKAVASIPSPVSGRVTQVHVKTGDEIKAGQVILSVAEEGAAEDAAPAETVKESTQTQSSRRTQPGSEAPVETSAPPAKGDTESFMTEQDRSRAGPPASPSIRKLARELGIDLARVRGSQHGGRIILSDVKVYIEKLQNVVFRERPAAAQAAGLGPPKPAPEPVDFSKWGPVHTQKMSVLRKTIAQKMVESWTTIPHVTQFDEADITRLNEMRKRFGGAYEKQGAKLTLTPLVLKTLTAALKKYPVFNASMDEATGDIVFKNYYHIGIAVDTDAGLIVPVIRDVDQKSVLELSKELEGLATRARERKVALEELRGGTFTISNQGGIGGSHFTPIINKPEAAILGLGRGTIKPVAGEKVRQAMMLPLALSYDHRLIDGADAARFIRELVQYLENFREEDVQIAQAQEKKGQK